MTHQHEEWQMRDSARGGRYCAACGDREEVAPAQVIPDSAVEAAAIAVYELTPVELFGREHPITWEQLSESPLGQRRKDNELTNARAALEAAAPHMLAAVWDEAIEAHKAWTWDDENMDPLTNPYRPTP